MYEDGRNYFVGVNFVRCLYIYIYIYIYIYTKPNYALCHLISVQEYSQTNPRQRKFCCTEYHTVTAIKVHVLLLAEQPFLSLLFRINELANIRTSSWGFVEPTGSSFCLGFNLPSQCDVVVQMHGAINKGFRYLVKLTHTVGPSKHQAETVTRDIHVE